MFPAPSFLKTRYWIHSKKLCTMSLSCFIYGTVFMLFQVFNCIFCFLVFIFYCCCFFLLFCCWVLLLCCCWFLLRCFWCWFWFYLYSCLKHDSKLSLWLTLWLFYCSCYNCCCSHCPFLWAHNFSNTKSLFLNIFLLFF